jgi:hypothetical protein
MHLDTWKSPLHLPAPLPTTARGCRTGLRRTLGRCRRRRSGLPARLIATLFSIFLFFEWGESELWANAKSANKTKDMIKKIKEVMGSFNRDTMAKACNSLKSRI